MQSLQTLIVNANPTLLFWILSFIAIIYLLLLKKINFFQKNPDLLWFKYHVILNFHFYFCIVYIFFFLLFSLVWYFCFVCDLLSDVLAFSVQEVIKLDSSNQQDALLNSTQIDKNSSSDSCNVINQNSKNDSSINSPKEVSPSPLKTWVQQIAERRITNQVVTTINSPEKDVAHVDMLKEAALGASKTHSSKIFDGPYSPSEINVPQDKIPTHSSCFSSVTVKIDGEEKSAYCIHPQGALDMYNKLYEHTTNQPRFSSRQQTAVDIGLSLLNGDEPRCIVCPKNISEKILEQVKSSSPSRNFPDHNLFD